VKELLELIVRNLVDHPDEVEISQVEGEKSLILEVKVHQDDMGKVIGKQGKIAKSIRTVVKAAAAKQGKKVIVEILR
jgi:predicted RNA-binding protein YlqC (UPF0109 family)